MDELTSKKQDVERANNEPQRHPTSVALSRPPATEVDAGTDVTLKVKVFCPSGCDLRGSTINVTAPDGLVVATSELVEHAEHANETAEFTFKTMFVPASTSAAGGRLSATVVRCGRGSSSARSALLLMRSSVCDEN